MFRMFKRAGEELIAVDGLSTSGKTLSDLRGLIVGPRSAPTISCTLNLLLVLISTLSITIRDPRFLRWLMRSLPLACWCPPCQAACAFADQGDCVAVPA
jgi:hypothetical protein